MRTRNKYLNLYWVSTEDHDEDWFILASNKISAARYHEIFEGYNPGEAQAELLFYHIDIPPGIPTYPPSHPRFDLLENLGAVKITGGKNEGKIWLKGRCFPEFEPSYEGMLGKPISTETFHPTLSK